MKTKIVTIQILFLLSLFTNSAFSQTLDLKGLEGMARSFDEQSQNDLEIEEQRGYKEERKGMLDSDKDEEESNSYGYTGSRDFSDIPQPKKFEDDLIPFGYQNYAVLT